MSKNIIEKALTQNNVLENEIVDIKTDTTTIFSIHLFKMLVLLLLNFSLQMQIEANDMYNFIMQKFNTIFDIVITQIEIELHNFVVLYDVKLTDIVELHCRDECILIDAMQEKVNNNLKKIY